MGFILVLRSGLYGFERYLVYANPQGTVSPLQAKTRKNEIILAREESTIFNPKKCSCAVRTHEHWDRVKGRLLTTAAAAAGTTAAATATAVVAATPAATAAAMSPTAATRGRTGRTGARCRRTGRTGRTGARCWRTGASCRRAGRTIARLTTGNASRAAPVEEEASLGRVGEAHNCHNQSHHN